MATTLKTKLKFELAQVYKEHLIVPFEVEGGWQGTIFDPDEGDWCWGSEETYPTPAAAIEGNKPVVEEYLRLLAEAK